MLKPASGEQSGTAREHGGAAKGAKESFEGAKGELWGIARLQ